MIMKKVLNKKKNHLIKNLIGFAVKINQTNQIKNLLMRILLNQDIKKEMKEELKIYFWSFLVQILVIKILSKE